MHFNSYTFKVPDLPPTTPSRTCQFLVTSTTLGYSHHGDYFNPAVPISPSTSPSDHTFREQLPDYSMLQLFLPSTSNPSAAISPSNSPSPTPGTIGDSEDRPAQSCHHVYQTDSSSPSGYYWINTTEGPTEAYCVMNPPDCNITGGWMRVVLHNMN